MSQEIPVYIEFAPGMFRVNPEWRAAQEEVAPVVEETVVTEESIAEPILEETVIEAEAKPTKKKNKK